MQSLVESAVSSLGTLLVSSYVKVTNVFIVRFKIRGHETGFINRSPLTH